MSDVDPKVVRDAKRVLAALYRLARGRTDITVSRADLWAEVARERLLDLSDEAFAAYRARGLEEVRAMRIIEGRPDVPSPSSGVDRGPK
jgi:hypothetical protein